jgi:hypothetical protein
MKWLLGCGTLFALALILFVVPAGLEGPVLVPISPGHGLSLVDVVALVPLLQEPVISAVGTLTPADSRASSSLQTDR